MGKYAKCPRCGDTMENRGMPRHEIWCKKATEEQRIQRKREREYQKTYNEKRKKLEVANIIQDVHVNGNRAYITISIDMASLRVVLSQLVPYINFHGIEIK